MEFLLIMRDNNYSVIVILQSASQEKGRGRTRAFFLYLSACHALFSSGFFFFCQGSQGVYLLFNCMSEIGLSVNILNK